MKGRFRIPVSYTHLDVYKRQIQRIARGKVVGVQIADDCLGFDFQQTAEVFRHVCLLYTSRCV